MYVLILHCILNGIFAKNKPLNLSILVVLLPWSHLIIFSLFWTHQISHQSHKSVFFPLQSPRMRRNGFELKMQDRYSHFLAADTEAEMEDWVITLKQALQSSSEAGQDRKNGVEAPDCAAGELQLFEGTISKMLQQIWLLHLHESLGGVPKYTEKKPQFILIWDRERCGIY